MSDRTRCNDYVVRCLPRKLRFRDDVVELNERYGQILHEAPHTRSYLDLWPALATADGTTELTSYDLHLSGVGHEAWAKSLRPELERPAAHSVDAADLR